MFYFQLSKYNNNYITQYIYGIRRINIYNSDITQLILPTLSIISWGKSLHNNNSCNYTDLRNIDETHWIAQAHNNNKMYLFHNVLHKALI